MPVKHHVAPPTKEPLQDSGAKEHYDKLLAVAYPHKIPARDKKDSEVHEDPGREPCSYDIFGRATAPRGQPSAHRTKMFPSDREAADIFNKAQRPNPQPLAIPTYISQPKVEYCQPRQKEELETALAECSLPDAQGATDPVDAMEAFWASPTYRSIIASSHGWGVRGLRHQLLRHDTDGDGILNKAELRNALLRAGVDPTQQDIDRLIKIAPAPPGNSRLLIPTLMDALRGELTAKRRNLLQQAYEMLLKDSNQTAETFTLGDLQSLVDYSAHPTFEPHVRGSLHKVMSTYSQLWGTGVPLNARVSLQQFIAFYHDIFPHVKNETDFVRVVKSMHGVK